MRTKVLLCAVALAASIGASVAQNVYSLNVVGYYNVPIPGAAYSLIANQLNTTNNTIASLFPNGPAGMQVLKYNAGWSSSTFDPDDLVWYPNGLATLNPGEGALVKPLAATTLTFVGEVQQGTLTVGMLFGQYAVRSSIVPQAGLISTDLKFPQEPGDQVLKYAGGWSSATFDPDDLVYYPAEPTFGVGEGIMFKKAATSTANWVRTFTVQ
jgi:hypothetical protein